MLAEGMPARTRSHPQRGPRLQPSPPHSRLRPYRRLLLSDNGGSARSPILPPPPFPLVPFPPPSPHPHTSFPARLLKLWPAAAAAAACRAAAHRSAPRAAAIRQPPAPAGAPASRPFAGPERRRAGPTGSSLGARASEAWESPQWRRRRRRSRWPRSHRPQDDGTGSPTGSAAVDSICGPRLASPAGLGVYGGSADRLHWRSSRCIFGGRPSWAVGHGRHGPPVRGKAFCNLTDRHEQA